MDLSQYSFVMFLYFIINSLIYPILKSINWSGIIRDRLKSFDLYFP